LWAPLGTPEEARIKLARAVAQVLSQAEVKQKMQALNGEALFVDTAEYRNLLGRESKVFSTLIKNRKIVLE